jgi:hypothetical protein
MNLLALLTLLPAYLFILILIDSMNEETIAMIFSLFFTFFLCFVTYWGFTNLFY